MRGLRNGSSTNGRSVFITVSNGVFTKRVKEATPTSIERELGSKSPNAGKIIHEEHFDEFEGRLLNVEVKQTDFGKSWVFSFDTSIDDNKETTLLSVDYSSGYASNILMRLPNLNLEMDIVLKAYDFTPKGETKARKGISISQMGTKILPAFTKENQNGCPEMKKVTVNGKDSWDVTDRMVFLETMSKGLFALKDAMPTQEEETQEEDLPF